MDSSNDYGFDVCDLGHIRILSTKLPSEKRTRKHPEKTRGIAAISRLQTTRLIQRIQTVKKVFK